MRTISNVESVCIKTCNVKSCSSFRSSEISALSQQNAMILNWSRWQMMTTFSHLTSCAQRTEAPASRLTQPLGTSTGQCPVLNRNISVFCCMLHSFFNVFVFCADIVRVCPVIRSLILLRSVKLWSWRLEVIDPHFFYPSTHHSEFLSLWVLATIYLSNFSKTIYI